MSPQPPARILETALYAEDLDAAERFYGGLLGLERVQRVAGRHVFYRCGSGMLLVFDPRATSEASAKGPPVPVHGARGPGHVCFAASGAEIEVWCARLVEGGCAIDADFRWSSGARSLYVRDPARNSVEFAEPAIWGMAVLGAGARYQRRRRHPARAPRAVTRAMAMAYHTT